MEVKKVELAAVGASLWQYPNDDLPQIAFAGKSNVGKSSLINTMIGRKSFARTSSQPGKTRTINFYLVNDAMYIVDLPGYGYAKAPKSEIAKLGHMTEEFLTKKKPKGIILLSDLRHLPGENDILMYNWLKHYDYKIIIAATKLDKLKKSQVEKNIKAMKECFGLSEEDALIPFSSVTKAGRLELWAEIDKLLNA